MDARKDVEGWKTIYKSTMEAKDKLVEERTVGLAETKKGAKEEARKAYEEKLRIRDQWKVDRLKVKILY